MSDLQRLLRLRGLEDRLAANTGRRHQLEEDLDANRVEQAELIRQLRQEGVTIPRLMELSGIGRERVYEILRGKERRRTGAGRRRKETP